MAFYESLHDVKTTACIYRISMTQRYTKLISEFQCTGLQSAIAGQADVYIRGERERDNSQPWQPYLGHSPCKQCLQIHSGLLRQLPPGQPCPWQTWQGEIVGTHHAQSGHIHVARMSYKLHRKGSCPHMPDQRQTSQHAAQKWRISASHDTGIWTRLCCGGHLHQDVLRGLTKLGFGRFGVEFGIYSYPSLSSCDLPDAWIFLENSVPRMCIAIKIGTACWSINEVYISLMWDAMSNGWDKGGIA